MLVSIIIGLYFFARSKHLPHADRFHLLHSERRAAVAIFAAYITLIDDGHAVDCAIAIDARTCLPSPLATSPLYVEGASPLLAPIECVGRFCASVAIVVAHGHARLHRHQIFAYRWAGAVFARLERAPELLMSVECARQVKRATHAVLSASNESTAAAIKSHCHACASPCAVTPARLAVSRHHFFLPRRST